jgi:hypothetical protein
MACITHTRVTHLYTYTLSLSSSLTYIYIHTYSGSHSLTHVLVWVQREVASGRPKGHAVCVDRVGPREVKYYTVRVGDAHVAWESKDAEHEYVCDNTLYSLTHIH